MWHDFATHCLLMSKGKRNVKKIVLVTLAVLVAGIGIAIGWLQVHYNSVIRKKLPVWVAKASDSLYRVKVSDVSLNLFTGSITIDSAKLWPDSARLSELTALGRRPKTVFSLSIPIVKATGISWGDKELACDRFYISEPDIVVTALPFDSGYAAKPKKRPELQRIKSNFIEIHKPTFTYHQYTTADSTTYYIKGGNIRIANWLFAPLDKDFSEKAFYGTLNELNVDSVAYMSTAGLYNISVGKIAIRGDEGKTAIKNFRLQPRYNKSTFYKVVGHQQEIFDISFPDITITGWNPDELLNNKTLSASTIKLSSPKIAVYNSRLPAPNPNSKMGKFPNQLVQRFGYQTNVRHIQINNGWMSYAELNPKTMLEGKFHISNISGTARNISNMPVMLQKNKHAVIDLKGLFMDASPMQATFTLNMADSNGAFSVAGEQTNLKASHVQNMARALAVIDIKSMHISKVKFKINADQHHSTGNLTMLYSDLSVTMLKAEGDGELDAKGLLSFIADVALIHDDNPMPDKEVRHATMAQTRSSSSSFFNLIWKTMFEGITETVMKNQDAAYLVHNKACGNAPEKQGLLKKIKQLFKKKK
jgi:hypothetical protein